MTQFHLAVSGSDDGPGTEMAPFATLHGAARAVRDARTAGADVEVIVHEGIHRLESTLRLTAANSGRPGAPVQWRAASGARPTISGNMHLDCRWEPYRDQILYCRVPESFGSRRMDQLFVDGKRQIRARWPNFDYADPERYSGYVRAAGAIPDDPQAMADAAPEANADMTFSSGAPRGIRFDTTGFPKRPWARPEEAVIHIYQAHYWGNLQWRIKAIDRDAGAIWFGDGGWQMGAKWSPDPCAVDERSVFFVDNVSAAKFSTRCV